MQKNRVLAPVLALASVVAAAPSSAGDWTQGYIGVGIGADVLTADIHAEAGLDDTLNANAPVGGDLGLSITAGADYQLNSHFIVGAFVTYDWSNIETTASLTFGQEAITANLLKIDQGWTVGTRLGVLAGPETMIYALLGYTWVELDDISVSGLGTSATFALPDAKGWTVGGGFEHRLTAAVSLRGEYRYTHFGQRTLFDDPDNGTVTGDANLHVARLIAAYRFGGTHDAIVADAEPSLSSWTGGYLGGGLGAEAFVRDLTVDVPLFGASGSLDGLGGGGFSGTLVAGYDIMIAPQFLAGAFASYDWSNTEFTVSASAFGEDASAEFLSLDRSWTIGGRAGVVIGGDALVYGLAGYTQVELNDSTFGGLGDVVTLAFPTLDGVTLGGGFEKRLTDAVTLRAEYRYTMLDDISMPVLDDLAEMTIDPSMHSAKLIATYRFATGQ